MKFKGKIILLATAIYTDVSIIYEYIKENSSQKLSFKQHFLKMCDELLPN